MVITIESETLTIFWALSDLSDDVDQARRGAFLLTVDMSAKFFLQPLIRLTTLPQTHQILI
jgi:hypothetical protein